MSVVFVDTWAWLALFNKRDSHHRTAVAVWRDLLRNGSRIFTSDFVWIETLNAMAAAPLRSAAIHGRRALLESGKVETVPLDVGHLGRGDDLYRQRHDKNGR
jgi:predicted nucleic acid-binding protein